jgi:nitroimidazol reductase NimA-like FMN-containing flavoprotein (pyridoxamine 5'-phosphate oxidase superfamily)
MPKDYAVLPRSHVRRNDRAVTDDAWIKDFLKRMPEGIMATAVDDQPFLNARNFAYDPDRHAIYMHGARVGRTPTNIAANKRVCFACYEMGRLLPAERAYNFSVEHAGVVAFGEIVVVEDDKEARHGLQLLMDKYFPHLKPEVDYISADADEMKRTAVFRIDIEEWSAKQKVAEPDFPGAFMYSDLPEASS